MAVAACAIKVYSKSGGVQARRVTDAQYVASRRHTVQPHLEGLHCISHQLDNKSIIHLHLFQALLLLPCMLLVDLLGEQLASLVCVHKILAELVTFLTEAVKRPSHYSGLGLKLKIDE